MAKMNPYRDEHYCVCEQALSVGRGGSLVESIPVDRRVVESNPALAATSGP